MIQKVITGVLIGMFIGLFTTSFFVTVASFQELFFTKITAASIITGFFVSIYACFSKSKFQIFLISIAIGMFIFYMKYLLTGHHFDPLTMGAFTGALLGGFFVFMHKIISSIKKYKRLEKLRKRGFNNYS